jgi:hypothetical protein
MSIDTALRLARESGGHLKVPKVHAPKVTKFHSGPIHSNVAGRTDHLPITVAHGSYVLPADIISGAGEGNTMAGFAHAKRVFGGMPRGGGAQPYNHEGGPYGMASGGAASGVPIVAAGGEYVVHPDHVRAVGGGDLDTGHKVLDQFVLEMRKNLVKTLKKLPGPRKN